MKIEKYITSLLPSFERGRILEDLSLMRKELVEFTLPPYVTAAQMYTTLKFQAKSTQNFDKEFARNARTKIPGNYIKVVSVVLERVSERFAQIEALVTKAYARDVTAGGITYLRANLLQYVEAISFSLRYSRHLLLWTLSEENLTTNPQSELVSALSKAEKEWLWTRREAFAHCMVILAIPTRDLETSLKGIPDLIAIPGQTEIAQQNLGSDRLDPLKFGLIPLALNPIYHLRIAIAEWQVARQKAAEQEALALEYRLLALRGSVDGVADAKLEQQITYTEGRLQKLNRKIAEMEGDANG